MNKDSFLDIAIYELILFILDCHIKDQDYGKVSLPIRVEGAFLPKTYCITIGERYSPSMFQNLRTQLTSNITGRWKSKDHYLPIAIASVIMNHFSGKFIIEPLKEKDHEFQLHFPFELVHHSSSNLNNTEE
ncbi:MAG: hypothetical protein ACXAB2_12520 [Candidatus Hodarchaeales archaeon]|jgi:hypothetical protein